MVTQGGNGHTRMEWSCEVDTRWEWSHEVDARWEWSHKVDVRSEWSHEVGMVMRGGNGHARYEPPSEVLYSLIFLFVTMTGSISGDGGGTSLPHQDSSATNADDIFRGKTLL